jgi:hypothetical protein
MMEKSGALTVNKECPIGRIEHATEELKAASSEILELSACIEGFLVGQNPKAEVEKEGEKSPNGWLECHWNDLYKIIDELRLAAIRLKTVEAISK